jgi:hypothetical protein
MILTIIKTRENTVTIHPSFVFLLLTTPLFLVPSYSLYYYPPLMDLLSFICCIYIPSNPNPIITSLADAPSSIHCSSLTQFVSFSDGLSGVPSIPIYLYSTPLYWECLPSCLCIYKLQYTQRISQAYPLVYLPYTCGILSLLVHQST